MKKTLSIVTSMVIIASCSLYFSTRLHAQQIPTNGLFAHWPFTGNANDIGPNANHGHPNNVTLTAGKQGVANLAYLFNSSTSFIGVPYDTGMNMGTGMSISAVFKPTSFYQGNCQGNYILVRGQQGTAGSYELDFNDNAYNTCSQFDANLVIVATNTGTDLSPGGSAFQSQTKVNTNTWYCVVSTMSNDTLKIYVNGVLTHTSTGWNIGSSTDSMCIGKYPWGGSSFPYNFTGVIDDIALYKRALSTAEVDSYCANAPKVGIPVDSGDTNVTVRYIDDLPNKVRLYPNPNNGRFTVNGTLNSKSAELMLFNMVGTVVHRSVVTVKGTVISKDIDVSALPAGMYMLKISSGDYTENIRFVKKE